MVGFTSSTHQVAGHKGALVARGLFAKPTKQQEIDFYQKLTTIDRAKQEEDLLGNALIDWVPVFYGTLMENQLNSTQDISKSLETVKFSAADIPSSVKPTDKQFIVLSNLYENFINPSILDIKLGSKLTDELADPDKVKRLQAVSESTTSGSMNLRICGMKLFNPSGSISQHMLDDFALKNRLSDTVTLVEEGDDFYLKFDKFFGRQLKPEDIKPAIKLFIYNGVPHPRIGHHYVMQFYKRLQLLYNCLLNYEIRIVSGSLLFIIENNRGVLEIEDLEEYDPLVREEEGDDDDDDKEDDDVDVDEYQIKSLSSLNLIDFAHSTFVPGQGIDENIIAGIENLMNVFEELANEIT